MKLGKAAELLELSIDETLTYHRFPDGHCGIKARNQGVRVVESPVIKIKVLP